MLAPASTPTLRRALLATVVALHLGASLLLVAPGHLSVDEGTYHFMVRSWDRGRGVEVWNGYRETPSPELIAATFSVEGDRLVAVPPEIYPLLALPFYRLAGYRGLFALNALAFLALLALTADLARRLTGDGELALDACLLLALGTFLWDYAQAAWPHATSALFVLAAFSAAVRALDAAAGWRRWGWAAGAGLVAGLAPGIRLDAAFALPAVLLPFLFTRPVRWRSALAAAVGTLPGLVALAAVNAAKFGEWTPFTYGREGSGANTGLAPYLPLIALGAVLLTAAWGASRQPVAEWLARRRWAVTAVAVLVAAAALALPAVRELALRLTDGAAQLLVDLRLRDPGIPEPALSRTAAGSMVYVGGLKRSLLQSCPYLTALVLPAVAAWRRRELRRPLLLLILVPAGFITPYALFAWHGGMSLNLRYFVPTLPFLAILTAVAGHRLAAGLSGRRWVGVAAAAGTAYAALFVLLLRTVGPWSPERMQPLLLDLPLGLAAVLLLLLLATVALGTRTTAVLRRAALVTFALAVVHAGLATFAYDVPWSHRLRARNLEHSQRALPVVSTDSIFFAPYPDPYFGLLEVDRLRLAVTGRDGFADFRRLVDHHLAAGRPVFASLPPPHWRHLASRGTLEGLTVEPLLPAGFVARITATPRTREEP